MALSLRAVLGATFGALRTQPIAPSAPVPARADVQVSLTSTSDAEWTLTFDLPAYSLADFNLLSEVRAYLVVEGHGLPSTAADYVASSYPFATVDVSAVQGGAQIVLPLPEVEPAKYFGQLVLLMDDAAPPAPPSPTLPSEKPPAAPDPVDPAAPTTG